MDIDTRGIVVTQSKDAFVVVDLIVEALRGLGEGCTEPPTPAAKCKVAHLADFRIFLIGTCIIKFHHRNEERKLWVHFNCDHEIKGVGLGRCGLILSLDSSNDSETLMRVVLKSLNGLGRCYITVSDFDTVHYDPV